MRGCPRRVSWGWAWFQQEGLGDDLVVRVEPGTDYYELSIARHAFLGQFLHRKLKFIARRKKTKKTNPSKETADQADIYLNMNCACFWLF